MNPEETKDRRDRVYMSSVARMQRSLFLAYYAWDSEAEDTRRLPASKRGALFESPSNKGRRCSW